MGSFADPLQRAMQVIGLDEQNSIFKVLATILWLGNVDFIEGDDGNAAISDTGVVDFVGYLMECDPTQVQKVLLTRVVETQRGGRRGQQFCSSGVGANFAQDRYTRCRRTLRKLRRAVMHWPRHCEYPIF